MHLSITCIDTEAENRISYEWIFCAKNSTWANIHPLPWNFTSKSIFPTYSSKKKDRDFFFYSLVCKEVLPGFHSQASSWVTLCLWWLTPWRCLVVSRDQLTTIKTKGCLNFLTEGKRWIIFKKCEARIYIKERKKTCSKPSKTIHFHYVEAFHCNYNWHVWFHEAYLIYESDKQRANREECRLYPHQLPLFFPNHNILPLFCTLCPRVPSIGHSCHFYRLLQSLHFAGTAHFRAMFLCSYPYSYWLSLGCYPGLNLTTFSTRSSFCLVLASCSLWLNIFSALKMEALWFSEKFSNSTIQRHIPENSTLHSHRC